jgi:hypothetical protein
MRMSAGGGSGLVGVHPASGGALADALIRAARDALERRDRISGLLAEAAQAAAAPAVLDATAAWARTTSADLRWRIDVLSDGGDALLLPGGMLLGALDFPDRVSAMRAGRAQAEALLRLLDGDDFEGAYRDVMANVAAAAAHSHDLAYSAGFANRLGGRGVEEFLNSVQSYSLFSPYTTSGDPEHYDIAARDQIADLLIPFDRVFAAASRSRDFDPAIARHLTGDDAAQPDLHLHMLLFEGAHGSSFLVPAAALLLRDGAREMMRERFDIDQEYGDRNHGSYVAAAALARNPEATLAFLQDRDNAELLLDDDRWRGIHRFPDKGAMAGRAMTQALLDLPVRDPSARPDAERATEHVVAAAADMAGTTTPLRRTLAQLVWPYMNDIMREADADTPAELDDKPSWDPDQPGFHLPREVLLDFFTDVLRDERARQTVQLSVGAVAHDTLDLAVARRAAGDGSAAEAQLAGSLYGLFGEAFREMELDRADRVEFFAGAAKNGASAAAALAVAFTSWAPPLAAAVGAGASAAIDQASEAAQNHYVGQALKDSERWPKEAEYQIQATVAESLVAHEAVDVGIPTRFLDDEGIFRVPSADAPQRADYDDWLRSDAGRPLHREVEEVWDEISDAVWQPITDLKD